MTIKDFIQNTFNKSSRVKEIHDEMRAHKLAEQRFKNANERELERYYEEKRQEAINGQLEKYRKEKTRDFYKSTFNKDKYMFKDKKPILKEKNIFKGK